MVSLMNSSRPISALDSPRVISSKTSSSRVVSIDTPGGGCWVFSLVKCLITRRVVRTFAVIA